MLLSILAAIAAGLLAGAAVLFSAAIQPAWVKLGPQAGLASYLALYPKQAVVMPALLVSAVGCGLAAYFTGGSRLGLIGTGLVFGVGAVTAYISPAIDRRLHAPNLAPQEIQDLLRRWGTWSLLRTAFAVAGFTVMALDS